MLHVFFFGGVGEGGGEGGGGGGGGGLRGIRSFLKNLSI